MTAALLDHLWQSSLFAAACAAMTLAFRANGAAVRFWLWFAASLKFLAPFAALAVLGKYLSGLFPHIAPLRLLSIQPVAEGMADPVRLLAASHPQTMSWAPWLAGLWLAGVAVVLLARLARGRRLKAALAGTRDLALAAPVPVKASASLQEPGLVGIFAPVILFPTGLLERLSPAEVDAILAHEGAHLARRDNLTAAIHMGVEALFWFHPLVWLIGARMIAERERACDETVLAHGHAREVYAGGILGVCKFCISSPLACAAGAGGADLGARLEHIMLSAPSRDVGGAKQLLLGSCVLASLLLPVAMGFVTSPLAVAVTSRVVAVQARAEEAISNSMAVVVQQISDAPAAHVSPAHIEARRLPRLKVAALPPVIPDPLPAVPTPDVPQAAPVPQVAQAAQAVPAAAAPPADPQPLQHAAMLLDPRGEGDPETVTCRVPQTLPGSHLTGPTVCKINRLWAELRVNHAVISPDGRQVEIPSDGERRRSLSATSCDLGRALGGASASITGLPLKFCF